MQASDLLKLKFLKIQNKCLSVMLIDVSEKLVHENYRLLPVLTYYIK